MTIELHVGLHSDQCFGGRPPSESLGQFLSAIPLLGRRAVRMRLEGRSAARGRRQDWLTAASDIRVVHHYDEDGATVLVLQAPQLGEAEEEVDEQQDFFRQRVVVLGQSVFRSPGRLLRTDAEELLPATDSDRFFSRVATRVGRATDVHRILHDQRGGKGLAGAIGKWPGDESDEEVERALIGLSRSSCPVPSYGTPAFSLPCCGETNWAGDSTKPMRFPPMSAISSFPRYPFDYLPPKIPWESPS